MVEITLTSTAAVFEVQRWDKLWALRSRLEIPLAHIRGVRADAEVARGWWHGFKLAGANVPGVITAGTFFHHGRRVFWDVHDPERTIVIELEHEFYDELIVEVEDPTLAVAQLKNSLPPPTA
jgi:hypothetical protein